MSNTNGRLSPLGAGVRRLWAELEIREGRLINASALAREATMAAPSSIAGPVQPTTPWSMILGREVAPAQAARLLHYLDVTPEICEKVGTGEVSAAEILQGRGAVA